MQKIIEDEAKFSQYDFWRKKWHLIRCGICIMVAGIYIACGGTRRLELPVLYLSGD